MAALPVIAVLTSSWGAAGESSWFTRQVAGALANAADVHIVTPGDGPASVDTDGVFTIHRLKSGSGDKAARRRNLLLDALADTGHDPSAPLPADVVERLEIDQAEPWADAEIALASIVPDRVVIADHRNIGALQAVDRYASSLPVTLIALAGEPADQAWNPFAPVVHRADGILTVTEDERQFLSDRYGRHDAIHSVGTPLAVNPSVLTEPNPWMGDTGYLLVITDVSMEDDDEQAELAQLLRMRFSDRPLGVVYQDGFVSWVGGRQQVSWAVERSSDLARLMAWAWVTVDLRTHELFGRDCLISLLYGTPIVVARDSPASQHARGGGGLSYTSVNELTWCVESLLDSAVAATFGAQGAAYAEDGFGSTDRFIGRVVAACGLGNGALAEPASSQLPITA